MNATVILDKMMQRYATCGSYRDAGSQCINKMTTLTKTFTTHFIRPDHFSLSWTEANESRPYRIWSNDLGTFESFPYDNFQIRDSHSLQTTVSNVAAMSGGLAPAIYSLLLPPTHSQEKIQLFLDIQDVEDAVENTVFKDISCYKITCLSKTAEKMRLWIGAEDFSLRKIKEYVVVTAEHFIEAMDVLREHDLDVYEKALETQPHPTPGWYFKETEYTSVTFDSPIDPRVFSTESMFPA